MGLFRRFAQSSDLVGGMADRLGIDMNARMMRDAEYEAPRFRSMVLRCADCSGHADCAALQADHAHLEAAPDYCRNKATLAAMRAS